MTYCCHTYFCHTYFFLRTFDIRILAIRTFVRYVLLSIRTLYRTYFIVTYICHTYFCHTYFFLRTFDIRILAIRPFVRYVLLSIRTLYRTYFSYTYFCPTYFCLRTFVIRTLAIRTLVRNPFINVRRGLGVACLSPGRVSAGVDRYLRALAASTGHALIAASLMYVPGTGCATLAAYNNYCGVSKFMPAGGINRFLPRLIPAGIN